MKILNIEHYLARKFREITRQKGGFQYAEIMRDATDGDPVWLDLLALQRVKYWNRVLFAVEETTLNPKQLFSAFRDNRIKLI